MISMHGVPSSLILRNQSWVRQQAQSLMRHLPSNVEKADLIQAGLIAVAQASLSFKWEGDKETEEARDAFVRYARMRVKGAMLDELRQRDHLGRSQRRKVKAMELARERWRASHGNEPTTEELGHACGMSGEEIFDLELAARSGYTVSLDDGGESDEMHPTAEPATAKDEVEARVDTGMLLRRLEKFFATLPERERQVIDAYLGVGLTPIELARSLKVSPTRVSQLFKSLCEQIGVHLGHTHQRSTDRLPRRAAVDLDGLITQRETELARSGAGRGWAEVVEEALSPWPDAADEGLQRIEVDDNTRWG
ncbi:sigma-70 family RNA polymerase sigma factor [Aquabacterium sp.]|uniref:sigma-70 family RNA polymerase sigma factor n=1 Tax=Aquabacterium sp. TaxID=1872578 RepID=UPI002C8DE8D8|nr:sigma-70 family RNA polymerase sigma factor [Aquabacterium sp.]HSW06465.1 sigma-70 family RNA polymerase sigma factor [Aquabacterium sp.]